MNVKFSSNVEMACSVFGDFGDVDFDERINLRKYLHLKCNSNLYEGFNSLIVMDP